MTQLMFNVQRESAWNQTSLLGQTTAFKIGQRKLNINCKRAVGLIGAPFSSSKATG